MAADSASTAAAAGMTVGTAVAAGS
jgi:hypothetical protein